MTDAFPDIEVYIKQPALDALLAFFDKYFDDCSNIASTDSNCKEISLTAGSVQIPCVVTFEAVKGGFASVWFKSAATPWRNDIDCARDAYQTLQREVRCSMGSWDTEEQEHEERWFCIDAGGESEIRWHT